MIHDSLHALGFSLVTASLGVKKTAHRIRGLDQHLQSQ